MIVGGYGSFYVFFSSPNQIKWCAFYTNDLFFLNFLKTISRDTDLKILLTK